MELSENCNYRAGFVAIIGAPNAGKSTLLNRLLGEKIAIVAAKPQTTRHRILGVLTEESGQLVFWDTPGVHLSTKILNQSMISRAKSAYADCDVCLLVLDGTDLDTDLSVLLDLIAEIKKPLVVVINKADLLQETRKKKVLAELKKQGKFLDPSFVSAKNGLGLDDLKRELIKLLPKNPPLYPDDTLTDQSLRAIAAELVREAVFRLTRQEIPYATAVTVDEYLEPDDSNNERNVCYISATIHVEKDNQKSVIIGQKGRMIKLIGQTARESIEKFLDAPVYLKLFVRTTKDWSKNKSSLLEFGYLEPGA